MKVFLDLDRLGDRLGELGLELGRAVASNLLVAVRAKDLDALLPDQAEELLGVAAHLGLSAGAHEVAHVGPVLAIFDEGYKML